MNKPTALPSIEVDLMGTSALPPPANATDQRPAERVRWIDLLAVVSLNISGILYLIGVYRLATLRAVSAYAIQVEQKISQDAMAMQAGEDTQDVPKLDLGPLQSEQFDRESTSLGDRLVIGVGEISGESRCSRIRLASRFDQGQINQVF
jgi:hypothetical protein